jgi:integrase
MRVQRVHNESMGGISYRLLDDADKPIAEIDGFMQYLGGRGCSPNTLSAYAHDLLHFARFLDRDGLSFETFAPAHALALLGYLRAVPSRSRAPRLGPVLATAADGRSAPRLSPATVNRILAAVSSFYEYLILSGAFAGGENPIQMVEDVPGVHVVERHRPFIGRASRQRPIRRAVGVKTVRRVPRPLSDEQVDRLTGGLRRLRDRAMILLMLQGGLRPGEVLNLRLEDIHYGRRRVVVRWCDDHPKGARTKSRTERVVDLHEPAALATLSAYVMRERPADVESPFVFLVGGHGRRRGEPLGYAALVKLFARACDRGGIREPWVTPHALRHSHATRLWEGGMRELALQKRLGHASPESTRLYTRVSDPMVVAEYRRALGEPGGNGEEARP